MAISLRRFEAWLALTVIVLLFPGFYFYHSALSLLGLPALLGGWFGPVALLLLVPISLVLFGAIKREIFNFCATDIVFIFFVFYCFLWICINYFFRLSYFSYEFVYIHSISALLFWLVLYFGSRGLNLYDNRVYRILVTSSVVMALIAVINMKDGFFYAAQASVSDDVVATYQGFARSFLVTSLISLVFLRGLYLCLFLIVVVLTLFLLGARSEFVGFIFAAFIWITARKINSWFYWVVLVFLSIFAFIALQSLEEVDAASRILELRDIKEGSSYLARSEMNEAAWESILASPVLGNYGSYAAVMGQGGYAHNAISAWVEYGLLGFATFIGLSLYVFLASFLHVFSLKDKADPIMAVAFCMAAYSLLMLVFSKSVYDPVFALGWGFYASAKTRHVFQQGSYL